MVQQCGLCLERTTLLTKHSSTLPAVRFGVQSNTIQNIQMCNDEKGIAIAFPCQRRLREQRSTPVVSIYPKNQPAVGSMKKRDIMPPGSTLVSLSTTHHILTQLNTRSLLQQLQQRVA